MVIIYNMVPESIVHVLMYRSMLLWMGVVDQKLNTKHDLIMLK